MILTKLCRKLELLKMPISYYAVASGRKPGIYNSWDECKAQVHQFHGAVFKKFSTQEGAQNFIKTKSSCTTENKKSAPNLETTAFTKRKRALPQIDTLSKKKLSVKKCKLIDFNEIPSSTCNKSSSGFMVDSDGYVNVYTDGACSSNGYKNAQAGIGVWFGEDHPLNVSEPVVGRRTNNNAEIQAVTMAAKKAKEAGVTKLKIITDSQFLIKCINQWMPKWKKNGWKTSVDKPVINKIELLEMEEALESLNIVWKHVNGHVGIHGNEMADKLARAGCTKV